MSIKLENIFNEFKLSGFSQILQSTQNEVNNNDNMFCV